MLKKDLMIPGNKLLVRNVIKSGVTLVKGDDQTKPYISLYQSPGSFFDGCHPVYSGETLEVVEKPKRRGEGGNCALVKTSKGVSGYAYWCELRISCDHI